MKKRCPHCKQELKKCRSGMMNVTLSSGFETFLRDRYGVAVSELDAAQKNEIQEDFRREFCHKLDLLSNGVGHELIQETQVSVYLQQDLSEGATSLLINLMAFDVAELLEEQMSTYKRKADGSGDKNAAEQKSRRRIDYTNQTKLVERFLLLANFPSRNSNTKKGNFSSGRYISNISCSHRTKMKNIAGLVV